MHQVQLELSDALYNQVQLRAAQAGFQSVVDYITDGLADEPFEEQENLDHRFTPEVMDYILRVSAEMQAGKSRSMAQVESSLEETRRAWRENQKG